jgi:hypothetical protein
MTAPDASVAISAGGINVKLSATVADDGSVDCKLACDSQSADIKFTGTDIIFDVHP